MDGLMLAAASWAVPFSRNEFFRNCEAAGAY